MSTAPESTGPSPAVSGAVSSRPLNLVADPTLATATHVSPPPVYLRGTTAAAPS